MNNQQNAMLKLATVRLAINHVLRQRAMQKQAAGSSGWRSEPFPAEDGAPPVSFIDAMRGENPYGDAQEKARQAHSKAQGYDKFEAPHWQFGGTVESKVPQVSFWNALWGRNPYGDAQEAARKRHSKAQGYNRFTGSHTMIDFDTEGSDRENMWKENQQVEQGFFDNPSNRGRALPEYIRMPKGPITFDRNIRY